MKNRAVISTAAAPSAIGPYSQAVKVGNTVWISGQIPLDPTTMEIVSGGIEAETRQVFANLQAIADAAGGSLDSSVKINISLTDLSNFQVVNAVMAEVFNEPYPARACVQVAALPKGVQVEIEAILAL
ncbi:RidA family protein [Candidatus Paraluminiphilus aquimaris]|jgi:reactive intermediate/imine deaminase|uniref:RidA family protein n=1 Tax=Candidatus Paraluminiphilus aquimaris TaxID=2518994 RepID=A0ABY6Q4Y7_9GAMM|nr:RidA family protein [Candidatus Paraluminiphilus aquimaris]UZP73679.1 RidA family protein [Candidatus Paraluminiphilus aquimaris]